MTELKMCKWIQCNDFEGSLEWKTDCGQMFSIYEGTPEDNNFRFCCYCGRKLKQEIEK